MKVEWRSVSVVYGVQCVMIIGVQQMLKLSADSLGFHQLVNEILYIAGNIGRN